MGIFSANTEKSSPGCILDVPLKNLHGKKLTLMLLLIATVRGQGLNEHTPVQKAQKFCLSYDLKFILKMQV